MLDHITLTVRDFERSRSFYAQALRPLGGGVQMEFEGMCGMGEPGKPSFWLKRGDPPTQPMHLAFAAASRPAVDSFHAAALAGGGSDNGGPGIRKDYHPSYYAAFVLDPDGHNVEAVCHAAPQRAAPRKASSGQKGSKRATATKRSASRAKASAARAAPKKRAGGGARKRGR